ncbi:MAG: hypothetical protein HXS54_12015 [Theionarchaea archaeon]|nr:hypothetical protein [Theionarchaea archaeon]
MKKFIGGLIVGVGIGFLICGFMASSLVGDFEYTIGKYDREIDDFYEFAHSYGFETVQDIIGQSSDIYKTTPPLRQVLETFGLGQMGQLLQDIDENLQKTIDISEDLYDAKSSVGEARSLISTLQIMGIILIGAGSAVTVWAFRQ